MGMSNLILDNVDKFWDIAETKVSECKDVREFTNKMGEYSNLLTGSDDAEYYEFQLYDVWENKK